jgi:hypothetical protein
MDKDALAQALQPEPLDEVKIEDLIENFLESSAAPLELIAEADFHLALHKFVEKDEKSAISE